MTRVAEEALLLLRMETDMALTRLASSRTVLLGAESSRGVHDAPPRWAWKHCHEKYVWTPVCFTTSPLHGLGQSYPTQSSYKFSLVSRPLGVSPAVSSPGPAGATPPPAFPPRVL